MQKIHVSSSSNKKASDITNNHKPIRSGLKPEHTELQYLQAVKIAIIFNFNFRACSNSPLNPEGPMVEMESNAYCMCFSAPFHLLKHHYTNRQSFGTHQHSIFLQMPGISEIAFNPKRDLCRPVICKDIWTPLITDHMHFALKRTTTLL